MRRSPSPMAAGSGRSFKPTGLVEARRSEGLGREQKETDLPPRSERPAELPALAGKNEGRNEGGGANVLRHVGVYANVRHNSSARL